LEPESKPALLKAVVSAANADAQARAVSGGGQLFPTRVWGQFGQSLAAKGPGTS